MQLILVSKCKPNVNKGYFSRHMLIYNIHNIYIYIYIYIYVCIYIYIYMYIYLYIDVSAYAHIFKYREKLENTFKK